MTTRTRAQQVMNAFCKGVQWGEDWDERNIAYALREAVEGLNIEPSPERELSIEKHHFIRGQNFVKDAIMKLADELETIAKEFDV
jgi:hypothetical protein